jgi:alpha-beta hydrolase superfamily lysophospholipase
MGGAIALSVAHSMDSVAGVVLLAPMLKLNVSSLEHGALQFLAFFLATVPLIPSSATDASRQYRDERKRNECEADTLTVSGSKLLVGSALACVDITLKIREKFFEISCPFFLMIADQDVVVKNQGSEDLFDKSPSTDKTKKHYPALHGLLCEPSPVFEEIKSDMLSWIKARVS